MAIDLSKQQTLDANPEIIQQINLIRQKMQQCYSLFVIEDTKESLLDS